MSSLTLESQNILARLSCRIEEYRHPAPMLQMNVVVILQAILNTFRDIQLDTEDGTPSETDAAIMFGKNIARQKRRGQTITTTLERSTNDKLGKILRGYLGELTMISDLMSEEIHEPSNHSNELPILVQINTVIKTLALDAQEIEPLSLMTILISLERAYANLIAQMNINTENGALKTALLNINKERSVGAKRAAMMREKRQNLTSTTALSDKTIQQLYQDDNTLNQWLSLMLGDDTLVDTLIYTIGNLGS